VVSIIFFSSGPVGWALGFIGDILKKGRNVFICLSLNSLSLNGLDVS